jgi:flagellar basal-body rod protein FlgB
LASDFFSDITSTALSKTLDAASTRQRTIANNIANVETPGYKRRYVQFEEQLKAALQEGGKDNVRRAMSRLTPSEQTDATSPGKPDGNNVNIDAEIADLVKVGLKHRAATVLLEGKIAMLRAAISEGKK